MNTVDLEFRGLIPPLQPAELQELEASLLAEGNRDPIVVWKETGILLDGHHRVDLCRKHDIALKPPLELSFPDRDSAKKWVIRNQFARRNLSPYQRSVLALKLEEICERETKAKERLRKTVQQTKADMPPGLFEKYMAILDEIDEQYAGQPGASPVPGIVTHILANCGDAGPGLRAIPIYTYFMQCGNKVKVGCSQDPEGRLKEFSKHIQEVHLLGYCKGGQKLEHELHLLWKDHRVNNEWYELNDFTVATIKAFVPEADFVQLDKVRSRKEAAAHFLVGDGTLARVKHIEEKATPEQKARLARSDATVNQVYVEVRRQEVRERVAQAKWPPGKYRVLYADPPWQYSNTQPDYHTVQDDHYPTMPLADICALPVRDLAWENAVLFLWATSPILEDAFKVLRAWGFEYKASFVWDKVKHNMGHYNSVRHEFLLVAVRGSCPPDVAKLVDSVQVIERGNHSAKPEEFRAIINTLYPHGRRIELFARVKAVGWEQFGDQVSGADISGL